MMTIDRLSLTALILGVGGVACASSDGRAAAGIRRVADSDARPEVGRVAKGPPRALVARPAKVHPPGSRSRASTSGHSPGSCTAGGRSPPRGACRSGFVGARCRSVLSRSAARPEVSAPMPTRADRWLRERSTRSERVRSRRARRPRSTVGATRIGRAGGGAQRSPLRSSSSSFFWVRR